jgi:hypothetical protein
MAATNFDTTRVRFGDMVAAVSGLVLFLSLFLNWYNVSVKAALGSASASVSGWEALSFIDILLFIIAVIAIAVAVARMANAFPRMAISPGLLVLAVGVLAVLLVLFRIIDIPGSGDVADVPGVDLGRSFGIFIALLAAIGVAAGGWLTWNEEGKPRPGAVGGGTGCCGARWRRGRAPAEHRGRLVSRPAWREAPALLGRIPVDAPHG